MRCFLIIYFIFFFLTRCSWSTELDIVFHCLSPYVICNPIPPEGIFPIPLQNISGFSVDVWNEVARIANITPINYYVSNNLIDWTNFLIENPAIGVSGLAETEYSAFFLKNSTPYYTTYLRSGELPSNSMSVTESIVYTFGFSPEIWAQLLFYIVIAIVVSHIVWLIEAVCSKENRENFPSKYPIGVWNGFYWAGVTTSTVGYGDKATKSELGKCSTLLWMLFSFFFCLTVSATLTTLTTVGQIAPPPIDVGDFTGKNVSVIQYSPALEVLYAVNSYIYSYPTLKDAYDSLVNQTTRYLLTDQASMVTLNASNDIIILTGPTFGIVEYVFSFNPSIGDDLITTVNEAILKFKFSKLGNYTFLVAHNFNVLAQSSASSSYKLVIVWACVIVGMIIIIMITTLVVNSIKRNKVKNST